MHVFFDLPASLTDAQVLAMVGANSQSNRLDRDLWTKDATNLTSGNHVATVVTYEMTGNNNVQRFAGYNVAGPNGAGPRHRKPVIELCRADAEIPTRPCEPGVRSQSRRLQESRAATRTRTQEHASDHPQARIEAPVKKDKSGKSGPVVAGLSPLRGCPFAQPRSGDKKITWG